MHYSQMYFTQHKQLLRTLGMPIVVSQLNAFVTEFSVLKIFNVINILCFLLLKVITRVFQHYHFVYLSVPHLPAIP